MAKEPDEPLKPGVFLQVFSPPVTTGLPEARLLDVISGLVGETLSDEDLQRRLLLIEPISKTLSFDEHEIRSMTAALIGSASKQYSEKYPIKGSLHPTENHQLLYEEKDALDDIYREKLTTLIGLLETCQKHHSAIENESGGFQLPARRAEVREANSANIGSAFKETLSALRILDSHQNPPIPAISAGKVFKQLDIKPSDLLQDAAVQLYMLCTLVHHHDTSSDAFPDAQARETLATTAREALDAMVARHAVEQTLNFQSKRKD